MYTRIQGKEPRPQGGSNPQKAEQRRRQTVTQRAKESLLSETVDLDLKNWDLRETKNHHRR